MEVYNKFPFEEVIVHPRTRVQLYNGLPNMESFDYAYKVSKNKLCYNGNVFSVEDYNDIVSNYDVDSVMLGRGLLRNPNLVNEIKVERRFPKKLYASFTISCTGILLRK